MSAKSQCSNATIKATPPIFFGMKLIDFWNSNKYFFLRFNEIRFNNQSNVFFQTQSDFLVRFGGSSWNAFENKTIQSPYTERAASMTTLTQARSSLFGSNKSNAPGTIDCNLRSSISEPNTTTTSKRQEEREREDPCNAIMSHKRKAKDGEIDLSLSLKIEPRKRSRLIREGG